MIFQIFRRIWTRSFLGLSQHQQTQKKTILILLLLTIAFTLLRTLVFLLLHMPHTAYLTVSSCSFLAVILFATRGLEPSRTSFAISLLLLIVQHSIVWNGFQVGLLGSTISTYALIMYSRRITQISIIGTFFAITFVGVIYNVRSKSQERKQEILSEAIFLMQVVSYIGSLLAIMYSSVLNARLEACFQNEQKRAFMGYISHEVRNAIAVVTLSLQVLRTNLIGSECNLPHVTRAENASHQIQQIMDNVSCLSKIESVKLTLARTVLRIPELLAVCVSMSQIGAQAKNVAVEVQMDATLDAPQYVDGPRVQQVVTNFLSNAVKFTAPRGSVWLNATVDTGRLRVSVRDTGVGITEEDQGKLFVMYSQLRPGELQAGGGTGLGLALCKQFVELHGGKIGVTSLVGLGSTFWFEIPLVDAPFQEQFMPLTTTARAGPPAETDVLIVEDNSLILELMQNMVFQMGRTVATAKNGQECLDMVDLGNTFHIILMDAMMPIMDGYTTTRELVKRQRLGTMQLTPIVGITGNGMDSDVIFFRECGVTDVFIKPISRNAFHDLIENYCPAKSPSVTHVQLEYNYSTQSLGTLNT